MQEEVAVILSGVRDAVSSGPQLVQLDPTIEHARIGRPQEPAKPLKQVDDMQDIRRIG